MEPFAAHSVIGDKFEVLELLGVGGMGHVYLARRVDQPDFRVALKVVDPELAHQFEYRERFRHEVLAGYRVSHRNVVQLYEYLDLGVLQACAMEFVAGGTLLHRLEADPLPRLEAVSVAKQIALGLQALHRSGTIHRDVKPENILLSVDGVAKLTDFGIAKIRGVASCDNEGLLVGTPTYVPPECVEHGDSDHRGDIYALGVVLYEMIAGVTPFRSVTRDSLLKERLSPHGLDLQERCSDCPDELAAIVARCVSVQPIARFPHCAALIEALVHIQATYGWCDPEEVQRTESRCRAAWREVLRAEEGAQA